MTTHSYIRRDLLHQNLDENNSNRKVQTVGTTDRYGTYLTVALVVSVIHTTIVYC